MNNKMNNNQLIINGLNQEIAYCEANGLSNCFKAYAEFCSRETIFEIGFNANSGYVYIALENMISICSMLGRDVEYLVMDFENDETFFDTYDDAVKFQDDLRNKFEIDNDL